MNDINVNTCVENIMEILRVNPQIMSSTDRYSEHELYSFTDDIQSLDSNEESKKRLEEMIRSFENKNMYFFDFVRTQQMLYSSINNMIDKIGEESFAIIYMNKMPKCNPDLICKDQEVIDLILFYNDCSHCVFSNDSSEQTIFGTL
jgi:hypothetical protein